MMRRLLHSSPALVSKHTTRHPKKTAKDSAPSQEKESGKDTESSTSPVRQTLDEPIDDDSQAPAFQLEIPPRTFFRIILFVALILAAWKLWPLISSVFLAILLAVAARPVMEWLEKRMPMWAALLVMVLGFVVVLLGMTALIIPTLVNQIMELGKSLPSLQDRALQHLPQEDWVQNGAHRLIDSLSQDHSAEKMVQPLLSTGSLLVGGVTELVITVVIAFYLLADKGGILHWFLAFFSTEKREKFHETAREVSQVIFSYVTGQLIMSGFVMIYTFTALSLLHVPGAVVLALLAAVFDVVPVLGFIISSVPAVLLALSVSLPVGLGIMGLYLLYHGIEVYVIMPRVFGARLRVSELSVLLGILGGSLLGGVTGAIVALPLLAAYPTIERLWLADYIGQLVVRRHRVQKERQFGRE